MDLQSRAPGVPGAEGEREASNGPSGRAPTPPGFPGQAAGLAMKFGGTSVADAGCIRTVARIVGERREQRPVVIVSALAGVTTRLLEAAEHAEAGRERELEAGLDGLRERHLAVVRELGLDLEEAVLAECARLAELCRGVRLLGECTPRARDAIAAVGELVSHRVVAAALEAAGVPAAPVDPRALVRTSDRFGRAEVDRTALRALAAEHLAPLVAAGRVPVTGGFVGATAAGHTTTLGRGGSDLSATLIGVALGVREVQIWTDVDGLMTADPRVVRGARTLETVGFREASELAFFGAKVLHPDTIHPAVADRIPVRVRNTLRPEARGTTIGEPPLIPPPVPGTLHAVAWKSPIAAVSLHSGRMLGSHGFLARVFEVFARWETAVDVVTTSEVSVSLTVERFEHLDAIRRELEAVAEVRVERDLALVCLVGCELLEHPELLGAILTTLEGVPLRMFCLGSSDVNLTLVVERARAEEVVRRLHERFLEVAPPALPRPRTTGSEDAVPGPARSGAAR